MCEHKSFRAAVHVHRHADGGLIGFSATVTLVCSDCEAQFRFVGLPNGTSSVVPTVSFDGFVASLPVVPTPNEITTGP